MNVYKEKEFTYKGFDCVILFIPLGHRCGYVGIPKGHRLYKKDCEHIKCHGGITYQDDWLHERDDEDVWWIGFDCGHCYDRRDIETARKYFSDEILNLEFLEHMSNNEHELRTLDYCIEECKNIVEQIIGG